METLGNPKALAPYMKPKDCTKGFCSLSCPKWCYLIFPPPPFSFPDDKSRSGPTFSPLVIVIIGILASAFVLLSYYAIISKYCANSGATRTRDHNLHPPNEDIMEEEVDHNNHDDHQPWVVCTVGLDEALIKTITLVKYNKGGGLVGNTNCSVCLGEFLEDDTLRLLPKCSHAFHVACIDIWLNSHSNCPLCRANIVSSFDHDENQLGNEEIRSSEEGRGMGDLEQVSGNLPKCPFRAFSDLGELGFRESSSVIEIADHGIGHMTRRSISMDHSNETRVPISDILRIDHGEEELQGGNCQLHDQSLKCVMSSVSMKRSSSTGRFLFSKHGRGSNAVIPI